MIHSVKLKQKLSNSMKLDNISINQMNILQVQGAIKQLSESNQSDINGYSKTMWLLMLEDQLQFKKYKAVINKKQQATQNYYRNIVFPTVQMVNKFVDNVANHLFHKHKIYSTTKNKVVG